MLSRNGKKRKELELPVGFVEELEDPESFPKAPDMKLGSSISSKGREYVCLDQRWSLKSDPRDRKGPCSPSKKLRFVEEPKVFGSFLKEPDMRFGSSTLSKGKEYGCLEHPWRLKTDRAG